MRACSTSHGETWIAKEIVRAYCELHSLGLAHSVETRLNGTLVGGLYGVHIRGAFFGETTFHHATDASKIALVHLVERIRTGGLHCDTQWIHASILSSSASNAAVGISESSLPVVDPWVRLLEPPVP